MLACWQRSLKHSDLCYNGSIILLPVSVLEVYLKQTYAVESPCSCTAESAVRQGRREGGMENRKEQPQLDRITVSIHVFYNPRSLVVCLLPNFTSLLLPLNSSTKHMSAVLFPAKEKVSGFPDLFWE